MVLGGRGENPASANKKEEEDDHDNYPLVGAPIVLLW